MIHVSTLLTYNKRYIVTREERKIGNEKYFKYFTQKQSCNVLFSLHQTIVVSNHSLV